MVGSGADCKPSSSLSDRLDATPLITRAERRSDTEGPLFTGVSERRHPKRIMKVSSAGIDLITHFEGVELAAYRDIAGVWTIGAGHTEGFHDGRFNAHSTITEREADELLLQDLATRERQLNEWATDNGVALHQAEFDALISFIYNVGFMAFMRSTAARRIKKGDRDGAATALTWWSKATVGGVLKTVDGLVRRRAAERDLFLSAPSEGCVEAPGKCAII